MEKGQRGMAVGTDAMVVVVVVVVVFLSVWRLLVRAGDHLVRVECRIEENLGKHKKGFPQTAATGHCSHRLSANQRLQVDQQLLLQEEQSPIHTCASIDSRTILTSLLARSLERTTRADMEAISLRT